MKPKIIRFGHRDFKIKYITHKQAQKKGIYGEVDTTTNIITVDDSLDNKITSNTIIHELMHIIAEQYHWNFPAKEEELVCETTGNALSDLFNQNPDFINYLVKSFKK